MIWYILIPLMVIGVAIAVAPVLLGSIRQDRPLKGGATETVESAAREAAFWNRTLRRDRAKQRPH